jgi:hypothetical protein
MVWKNFDWTIVEAKKINVNVYFPNISITTRLIVEGILRL